MAKKKAGRPETQDKRKPFNLRLKSSILARLKERAEQERRPQNTIVEMILEKELV